RQTSRQLADWRTARSVLRRPRYKVFIAPEAAARPIYKVTWCSPRRRLCTPIPTRSMQPIPHVPGYELFERLGGGPMTAVYAAREGGSDKPCAVKVLRPDWDDPDTGAKLLQREARAGLAVRHPHLVRILDAHVTRPPF